MVTGWIVLFLAAAPLVGWLLLLTAHRRSYPIRELPGFLSVAECRHLIEVAEPRLRMSKVSLKEGSDRQVSRESGTAFLEHARDPIIRRIKERVAELSETPVGNQELIQVTHYVTTQHYAPHFDSLRSYGVDPGPGGDRYATVIIYLSDEYRGGATYFPRLRRRIQPELGKAVFFHNLNEDGKSWNRLSFHAGEPVLDGEKWICNQWIRQRSHSRRPKSGRAAKPGRRRRHR